MKLGRPSIILYLQYYYPKPSCQVFGKSLFTYIIVYQHLIAKLKLKCNNIIIINNFI